MLVYKKYYLKGTKVSIKQNFSAYQQSIGEQLKIEKDRIRNLIGSSHWLTDGEYKESLLKKVLRMFLPELYRVGTGFICYPDIKKGGDNSSQIDILITSKIFPTLYKSGELHFVTPECVSAIIEVKTKLTKEQIKKELLKLSDNIEKIRKNLPKDQECWAGLFIYNKGQLEEKKVLEALKEASKGELNRVVNCVTVGEHMFFRFWEDDYPELKIKKHVWHSYKIDSFSMAYFIGNIVASLSPVFTNMASNAMFPIKGTKEIMRKSCIGLDDSIECNSTKKENP